MTIGFFSPLPLAYMVPFMAAQSLAMGEAFGKSFQFGKRKISAMSNEKFNAFTFQDMNNELVADIASLIPTMNNQLNQSIELQKNIFKHMLGLIPVFINEVAIAANQVASNFFHPVEHIAESVGSLVESVGSFELVPSAFGDTSTSDTTNFNEGTVEDIPIKETSKYSQAIFRAMSLDELIKGINSGRFTGSDLSLAKHVLATRQEPTDQTLIPTIATAEQTAHQAWQTKLVNHQREFLEAVKAMAQFASRKDSIGQRTYARQQNKKREHASAIRAMSNDYRSSNNAIRRAALTLRQQIANGLLK